MKRIIAIFFACLLVVVVAWSLYAATGSEMVYPRFNASDPATSKPLVGGQVWSFKPGTTTPKALFTDRDLLYPASNPVVLDSNGEAEIWGAGFYDLQLDRKPTLTTIPPQHGSPIFTFGNWSGINSGIGADLVDIAKYDDNICQAVAVIGSSTVTTLTIGHAITENTGCTITPNITLWVPDPGSISVSIGKTVLDHGKFIAEATQKFTGTGTWSFANGTQGVISPNWWAKNTIQGVTDMGAALQSAVTASPIGATISLNSGETYGVSATQAVNLESSFPHYCTIIAKSGMHIIGDGNSTIKVLNGQSSSSSPKAYDVICSNDHITNVLLDGIVFDLNGQNNYINTTPFSVPGHYPGNLYNTAALIVSGKAANSGGSGSDARIDDSKIINCTFKNAPGSSSIVLGQSNASSEMSNNVEVAHNTFYNNGINTVDHSTIYGWGNNVNIHDNSFDMPLMSMGFQLDANGYTGPQVAAELHGNYNLFINNHVKNYKQGLWLGSNYTETAQKQIVANNTFYVSYSAMGLASSGESGVYGNEDILIANNNIEITCDLEAYLVGLGIACRGISIEPQYGSINRVQVMGNIIQSARTVAPPSYGIAIRNMVLGTVLSGVSIGENFIAGSQYGIAIEDSNGTLNALVIQGNRIQNLIKISGSVNYPMYLRIIGSPSKTPAVLNDVTLSGNSMVYTGGNSTSVGVYLTQHIGSMIEEGNTFYGMSMDRWDNNSTISNRYARMDQSVNNLTVTNYGTSYAPLTVQNYTSNNTSVLPVSKYVRGLTTGVNGSDGQGLSIPFWFTNNSGYPFKACEMYVTVDNGTSSRENSSFKVKCTVHGTLVDKAAW